MQKVILTIGLPASGKTTWARNFIDEENNINNGESYWNRVNNDDIREELMVKNHVEKWTPKFEESVRKERIKLVTEHLSNNENVVLDNTHLNPNTLRKTKEWLKQSFPDVVIEEKSFLNIPVHACLDRDKAREKEGKRFVGSDVILKMARDAKIEMYPKKEREPYLDPAIICDLDGTLSLFGNRRDPYDASNCDVVDEVNPAVKLVLDRFLYENARIKVFFFSGRTDKYKEQTIRFIEEKAQYKFALKPYNHLEMRKEGDKRPDEIVKREMYENLVDGKYNVKFVFDDRPKVIRMWRSLGLYVFDVGDGIEF